MTQSRGRIHLCCPECGHIQEESARVFSTNCRQCGQHMKTAKCLWSNPDKPPHGLLEKIKSYLGLTTIPLAKPPTPTSHTTPPEDETDLPPPPKLEFEDLSGHQTPPVHQDFRTPAGSKPSISANPTPSLFDYNAANPEPTPPQPTDSTTPTPPGLLRPVRKTSPRPARPSQISEKDAAESKRFRMRNQRELQCFTCGHTYHASKIAIESTCPNCNAVCRTDDIRIENERSDAVLTVGNLLIMKTGQLGEGLSGCQNFTAYGRFHGTVHALGRAEIHSSGTFPGAITSRHCSIERKSNLILKGPIITSNLYIEGSLEAKAVVVTDMLRLASGAILRGTVLTKAVEMDDNATMDADLQIVADPMKTYQSMQSQSSSTI